MRHNDRIDGYLPYRALQGLNAAYIASQKPSRQCSCRFEPHRNLHCMPGSGQSKGISLPSTGFMYTHQLICLLLQNILLAVQPCILSYSSHSKNIFTSKFSGLGQGQSVRRGLLRARQQDRERLKQGESELKEEWGKRKERKKKKH